MTSTKKPGPGLKKGWVEVDVRQLRGELTVQEAADRIGVGRRQWQRWESVGRMPEDALFMFKNGGQDEG